MDNFSYFNKESCILGTPQHMILRRQNNYHLCILISPHLKLLDMLICFEQLCPVVLSSEFVKCMSVKSIVCPGNISKEAS